MILAQDLQRFDLPPGTQDILIHAPWDLDALKVHDDDGSTRFQARRQHRGRKRRSPAGPVVDYFHQVDDPYSYLAVQKLNALKDRYSVTFKPHLVAPPPASFKGDEHNFDTWAREDAAAIAAGFGVDFAPRLSAPSREARLAAEATLAALLPDPRFAEEAYRLGTCLWQGEPLTMPPGKDGASAVARGTALRKRLGHYQGAMFYFEGSGIGVSIAEGSRSSAREEGFDREGGAPVAAEPPCLPAQTPAP